MMWIFFCLAIRGFYRQAFIGMRTLRFCGIAFFRALKGSKLPATLADHLGRGVWVFDRPRSQVILTVSGLRRRRFLRNVGLAYCRGGGAAIAPLRRRTGAIAARSRQHARLTFRRDRLLQSPETVKVTCDLGRSNTQTSLPQVTSQSRR